MHRFSLSGPGWLFRDGAGGKWKPAVVPGCVHTDLRRARVIPDPFFGTNELDLQWIDERDWEYRTTFHAPAALLAEEVCELVADGLDTVATVRLNGRVVGRAENMFLAHRWNVKRWLRRGRNELGIRFESAMRHLRTHRTGLDFGEINDPFGRAPALRKQQSQFGWDWGPRFVTAGIWRDLRLEGWSGNRLADLRITQTHAGDGGVVLDFAPELARAKAGIQVGGVVRRDGRVVAVIDRGRARVDRAGRWWPAGQGAQALYTVEARVLLPNGGTLGRWTRRIGLRTVTLDRHPDAGGETFQFVVNGRPVFAKGANWIPAHAFVAGLTRADYARRLRAAAAANMNMLRVWGGGIYESDDFYDLCDELGLLVWQDFMFAGAVYPDDDAFVASVRTEAEQQVRRLRHHACLALWCGNNEIELFNAPRLRRRGPRAAYRILFHRVLPGAVRTLDGATPYWPSSPHRPDGDLTHAAGERHGDTHYWDVWHARRPVKDYERWRFRFCSEFGMQSYSSPETNATFCPPADTNLLGPAMENHQKNRGGNQVILDYVSRRYRLPKTADDLVYLSQLNQAHCMQTGVEHYRRLRPHCMGALYWQLNDCWPAASWSSLEFTGRWRALHHAARRFFAPLLVCAHVPGDEDTTVGNYRRSTVRRVHLHTVSDAPAPTRARLRWELRHLDGRVLRRGRKAVVLRPGESVRQATLDLAVPLARFGRDRLYLRIGLDVAGREVSGDSVLLAPPRFLDLPRPRTRVAVRLAAPRRAELTFRSSGFQHRFAFDLRGLVHQAADNYFELYPGVPRTVAVTLDRPATAARVRRALVHRSLADTY